MSKNNMENKRFSEFCPVHDYVVDTQRDIKRGFKWLIGLHVSELIVVIGGLLGVVGILITKG